MTRELQAHFDDIVTECKEVTEWNRQNNSNLKTTKEDIRYKCVSLIHLYCDYPDEDYRIELDVSNGNLDTSYLTLAPIDGYPPFSIIHKAVHKSIDTFEDFLGFSKWIQKMPTTKGHHDQNAQHNYIQTRYPEYYL